MSSGSSALSFNPPAGQPIAKGDNHYDASRPPLKYDPSAAREIARPFVAGYLRLPNYTNPLRDLGYTDDDLTDSVSDRLVDAIVSWGTPAQIASRVQAHLDAGADHVCIQVIGPRDASPLDVLRELAPALL